MIRIGQQIAQALAAAHTHGIVYRDIKPENILVPPDGYVKVVDFGLARQMAADGSTSTFGITAGTLQYMSPKQVQGSSVSPARCPETQNLVECAGVCCNRRRSRWVVYLLHSGLHALSGPQDSTAHFAGWVGIRSGTLAGRPVRRFHLG